MQRILLQLIAALFASVVIFFFAISLLLDIKLLETFNMISLIAQNIFERRMKIEVYIALIFAFIPLFSVFYFNYDGSLKSHGKARFAKLKDIFKMELFIKKIIDDKKNGFMLGKISFDKAVSFDKPLACLIVAPPGSGKSQAVAIPNLLTLPQSCVVLDIKGELFEITAGYRQKKLKNRILVFDPMKEEERVDTDLQFNPFDFRLVSKMNINQKVRLVNEIANTIFVSDKKDHWDEQAKNLFIFYALYDLCTKNCSSFYELSQATKRDFRKLIHPKSRFYKMIYQCNKDGFLIYDSNGFPIPNNEITLREIENFYYEQIAEQKYADIEDLNNYKEESLEEIQNNIKNGKEELLETLRNSARQWATTGQTDEFTGIKSTFNRFMQVFTYDQVRRSTENMSFEYDDLREERITIYVKIAQTDIETLAPLIRIFLESIGKNLLLKENKDPNKFVYLILDEFIRFGKLEFLMEMPALCRSYGVIPVYITQSYALIEKHYSKEDLRIINETVAYKIIFKLNDADAAEMVSKEIGDFTRLNRSQTASKNDILTGGSTSTSKEGVKLITAQDILNLPSTKVIILVTGYKATPIKLEANYFYKNRKLKKRGNWKLEQNPLKTQKEDAIKPQELQTIQEKEAQEAQEEFIQQEYQKILEQAGFNADEKEYLKEYSQKENLFEEDTQETPEQEKVMQKEYVKEITDKEILIKLYPPQSIEHCEPKILEKIKQDEEILQAIEEQKEVRIMDFE